MTDERKPLDPGAYIGREPELASETIPGGVQPEDDRISGHQSQGTGVGRPDERGEPPRAGARLSSLGPGRVPRRAGAPSSTRRRTRGAPDPAARVAPSGSDRPRGPPRRGDPSGAGRDPAH